MDVVVELQNKLATMEHELALMKKAQFGRKSERTKMPRPDAGKAAIMIKRRVRHVETWARLNKGMIEDSSAREIYKFLGSSQSRRASPRKLKDKTVITSAIEGKITRWGASNK